jgi:oxygen-independent coproporphyrinogen-3 oxidase
MDKLYRYRQAGINRISIGLQSCNNEELKKLGRIHTYEEFEHSFIMARDAGFNNINIDIMSAIPDQTIASYKETLHKVVSLRPQHISAYSLIIEEGTPFFSEYGKGSKNENKLPDEDTDREMYHLTKAYLKENGYERYEISNYARSEKECKHNIKYWNRDNYYGFGVSAASLVDNVRYTNISDIINYVENEGKPQYIRESEDIINKQEQMEEYMILGLRKMKGICIKDFNRIFDTKIENIYGETLEKMCNNGLMECDSGYYRLTEYGIDVSNIVLAEFL